MTVLEELQQYATGSPIAEKIIETVELFRKCQGLDTTQPVPTKTIQSDIPESCCDMCELRALQEEN